MVSLCHQKSLITMDVGTNISMSSVNGPLASTPVNKWRILFEQSFSIHMPVMTANGIVVLRWSTVVSSQWCCLHCLHNLAHH